MLTKKQLIWHNQHKKKRYKKQLERRKNGQNASLLLFRNDSVHEGILAILGEELAQKFIDEVYKEIQEQKGAKICQRKHSFKNLLVNLEGQ